ncbi:MAG TPA: DUF6544 family protein [Xanthomarina sp.]|nr:DUF6544 family protein [Xanthomarina sp.]
MKYVFSIIILIHGLIHLLGFIKGFNLTETNSLSQSISKPIGILWLLTFLLFLTTTATYIKNYKFWFVFAFITLILSQILILMFWKDAKFGTLANVLIFLVSLYAYGKFQFNNMVKNETKQVLQHISAEKPSVILEKDLTHLPEIVQKWLKNSGVVGQEQSRFIRLKQIGEMRTKPEGKWMPFIAKQTFNVDEPAFVWDTEVEAMPLISLVGRDKLYQGKGSMLIKLAALIPVVNESKNKQMNSGAMIRFLAEMCWFPSAALNKYITWQAIGENSAKATLTIKDVSVFGMFRFSKDGDITSFEAQRYYGGNTTSKLETWRVNMTSYKTFHGIKIPNKNSVCWKLKEGDFNWLNLEILAVDRVITEN